MDNSGSEQPKQTRYKVAAASSDGIVVNRHFGRADTFYIYEVAENGSYQLLEKRTVVPICNGGNHNNQKLSDNISKLKDCNYIIVSRIGAGAANAVKQSGIIPMELPGMIEEAVRQIITYEKLQNLF